MPVEQHYAFVHIGLRDYTSGDPQRAFGDLFGVNGRVRLQHIWSWAGEQAGVPASPLPEAVRTYALRTSPRSFLGIVTLPPPSEVGEAYFAGVALSAGERRSWLERVPVQVALYTLEKTFQDATVLCAWMDGGHLNFGEAPPVSERAFVEAVRRRIARA